VTCHLCLHSKAQGVIGTTGGDEFVGRQRQRARLRPFLQGGLRIARRAFHFIGERLPEAPHKIRRGRKAAIEVDRCDQSLTDIGKNPGIASGPRRLPGGGYPQMGFEPDRTGDAGERLPPNQMSQAAGQVPFRLVLEAPPQEIRDHQAQNPIAEKFEALIAALRRLSAAAAAGVRGCKGARMGQRLFQDCRPGERIPDYLLQVAVRQRGFC